MPMPFALARYWDSLESSDYVEPKKITDRKGISRAQREWLSELSFATDHECLTILYAKSLLEEEGERAVSTQTKPGDTVVPQKIAVRATQTNSEEGKAHARCQSLSSSTGNLAPPPKPQRRIARLRNSRNDPVDSVHNSAPTYSTLDLIESCKFNENYATINPKPKTAHFASSSFKKVREDTPTVTTPRTANWTPPGFRVRADSTILNLSGSTSSLSSKPAPPKYEELQLRGERGGSTKSVVNRRTPGLRHTIAVNQEDVEKAKNNYSRITIGHLPPCSPKSMHSDSTLSVDSGQCSGDMPLHSFSSTKEERVLPENSRVFSRCQQKTLPGYARMASTMDHVLRTSSALYTLLSATLTEAKSRDLVAKSHVFIQILESSPCANNLPNQDINGVKQQICEIQQVSKETGKHLAVSNYFTIVVRKMIEQALQIFAKIISNYLSECGNKDRLVVIALEHLIHIALFGDELCLEIIESGGLSSVVTLVKSPSTPNDTNRLLLRVLAVLCGVSKGCISLLALGGLEMVLKHLSSTSVACSIEAAGILTQLTNPQHSFVQLGEIEPIVSRLLDLTDNCATGESLLLVSAAISNVSLQDPLAVDILYKQSAILRLIEAYNRQECSTIFVQEQIVTILSRLAARRYEEALVAQGAVPILLEMLTVTDSMHSDYCRRIRYKAAVCIGTLAATGIGLKALYTNQGYAILCHVLETDNSASNPLNMICTNIRNQLESKYQIESAV